MTHVADAGRLGNALPGRLERIAMTRTALSASILAACCLSWMPSASAAGTAILLLEEQRNLPDLFPPFAPTGLSSSSVHSNGSGFVVKAASNSGDFFWGRADAVDTDGNLYGLVGIATGNSVTGSLPMAALSSDGRVLFSTAGSPYRLWEIPANSPADPAAVIAAAGTKLPLALAAALGVSDEDYFGNYLSTFSYSDDRPVWRATWNDVPPATASAFPPNWSLIKGWPDGSGDDAPLVLVAPGQQFPNVPNPVASTTSIRAYGFTSVGVARQGDNHIVEIYMTRTDGVTANDDSVMILNGEGLVLGDTLVRERNLIPASVGGLSGEDYRAFKAAHISATGDYGFRVQAFRPGPTFNELLFINGEVALREGDVLPFNGVDYTLAGGNLDYELVFNSDGDWVTNWNTTADHDVLIVNGEIVAASQATPVDSTGDGQGDTLFGLMALVIDRLAITDRSPDGQVDVVFQAFGSGATAIRQGVYSIRVPVVETHTVTASIVAGQGSIDPEQQTVASGGDAVFVVEPALNWQVDEITGDTCTPVDNGDSTWTASAIIEDCAIEVRFEPADRIFQDGFEGPDPTAIN